MSNPNNKPVAHIEDWILVGNNDHRSLIGAVSNHERQAEFGMPYQRTSRLVSIDEEAKVAETANTWYTLGNKFDEVSQ